MARKKKTLEKRYRFDTDAKYRMPMLRIGEGNRIYKNEVPNILCSIEQDDRDAVRAFAPGFQDKWFEGQYFDWILYTGYVKKEE